jgi:diguanylate cyclase (GGDEF)-like protein/PAS domain S-box-containing protein
MAQQLERFSQQVALSLVNARHQRQIKVQTEALEAAANAVVITDREGQVQWVNQAFTKLTGYSRDEIIGKTPRMLQSGMHERAFYSNLWTTILKGETWRGEVVNRCKDGSLCIEEQIITPVATTGAEISHFIAVKQDITERRKQERKLRHLATHEPLTGLPNRHALEERLEEACREAAAGRSGALLHLDLDDFRLFNDAAGYTVGDRLLEGIANLLQNSVRRRDFVARPGGDEFAVVLDDVDLAEAQRIARRLQQIVHSFKFELGSHHFDPTVSIGAVGIDGGLEPQMLLSLADAAVQAAKEQGKKRIVFHHQLDDVRLDVGRMCRLAGMVEEALECNGFVFHFQPIVSMKTGQASCFEVLLRMPGEDGQLLFPGEFMPAASRYRLETGIDRWVITHVLQLLQEYPGLTLSLNISSPTLSDPRVLDSIEQELGKDRDLASRLFLEISENTIMADLEGLAEWMERINDLGSCFFLDDFGSGFSSLVYIRTLPLYGIKIDGSFVQNIAEDSTNRAMVEAMNMMGQTLGMEVIAEWVETREAAQVLQQIGLEYGQGFFLGRPVPGLPQDGVAVDLFGQVD